MVSASSKTVVKGSVHNVLTVMRTLTLFINLKLVDLSWVLFETTTGKSCLILPTPSLEFTQPYT